MKIANLLNESVIHDILPFCRAEEMGCLSVTCRTVRNMTLNAALSHFSEAFKVPLGDPKRTYPDSDLTLFAMVDCSNEKGQAVEAMQTAFDFACSMLGSAGMSQPQS